jgi:hypothetical protein
MGESELVGARPVQHCRRQRAGLGDEGQLARACIDMREARVQANAGNEQPDAIRAQDAQAVRLCGIEHGRYGRPPVVQRGGVESGRQYRHRTCSEGPQLGNQLRYRLRGRADHRQVGRPGQLVDGAIGTLAGHGRVAQVHRPDRALEPTGKHVTYDRGTDAVGSVRRANDRDGMRLHELLQIARTQATVPAPSRGRMDVVSLVAPMAEPAVHSRPAHRADGPAST